MPKRHNRGFTVVEFLVAIAVFSVASILVYSVFSTQYQFFLEQQEYAAMDLKMNSALRIIAQDIQLAGANPQGAAAVSAVTPLLVDDDDANGIADNNLPDSIRLRSDRDGDGAIGTGNEDVILRFDSVNKMLLRNGLPIMDRVKAVRFRYWNKAGVEFQTPPDAGNMANVILNQNNISLVKLYLDVEGDVQNPNSHTKPARSLMVAARIMSRQ